MKRFTFIEAWLLFVVLLAIISLAVTGCGTLPPWLTARTGARAESEASRTETTKDADMASAEKVRLTPPAATGAERGPSEDATIELTPDGLLVRMRFPVGTPLEVDRTTATTGAEGRVEESAGASNELMGATGGDMQAPTARLPSGGSAGGGAISFLVEKVTGSSLWILHAGGVLIIAAGLAVVVLLKMPGKGLLICAGGGAVAMVPTLMEQYPWVVLALPGLGIGAVAWLLWGLRSGQRKDVAFGAVARGVQLADEDGKVRETIGNLAGVEGSPVRRLVKAEVTKVRKAEGLA